MYSVYLECCAPQLSLLFKPNNFFSLALFSPKILNGRETKLTNNIKIKRFFKDLLDLFHCQGHLKHFLEDDRFCRKSGNDA